MSSKLQDFPFLSLIKSGLKFIWIARWDFVILAAFPSFILTAVSVFDLAGMKSLSIPEQATPEIIVETVMTSLSLGFFAALIIKFLVTIMFAVAWFRRWLLPDATETLWQSLAWRAEKTKLMVVWFFLAIAILVAISVIMTLGQLLNLPIQIFGLLIVIALIYGLGRISLIFPAISLGEPFTIKQAWAASQGHGWYLAGITFLPSLLGGIVFMVLNIFGQWLMTSLAENLTAMALYNLIMVMVSFVPTAWQITNLSMAYALLQNKEAVARLR